MVSPKAIRITRASDIMAGEVKKVPMPGKSADKLSPSICSYF